MGGMKDLFGDTPYKPPKPEPEPKAGLELGHAAAKEAADHAGDEWKERAFTALLRFTLSHRTFTIEELREASPEVGEPPDRRAWGQVPLRAARKGIIRKIGWVEAKDPAVHGNAVSLWETIG